MMLWCWYWIFPFHVRRGPTPLSAASRSVKIEDVLASRRDGRTALVVYAGDAHTVIPLTDDGRTILNLLPALEPSIMPVLGSRLGPALRQASELLDGTAPGEGRILLLTDGLGEERPESAAAESRYPVFVLGLGTKAGAPIPLAALGRSGFLEEGGRRVLARLDDQALARLARTTGGSYAPFDAQGADLAALGAAERALSEAEASDSSFELWVDSGPWLVYPLLAFALSLSSGASRRSAHAAVPRADDEHAC